MLDIRLVESQGRKVGIGSRQRQFRLGTLAPIPLSLTVLLAPFLQDLSKAPLTELTADEHAEVKFVLADENPQAFPASFARLCLSRELPAALPPMQAL